MARTFDSVDEYMASLPEQTKPVLTELHQHVQALVPDAEPTISYSIPAFRRGKRVFVYIAGYAKHVGLYPIPDGDEAFESLIAPYRHGKGTLRFALDQPLPYDVIDHVVTLLAERAPA